MAKSIQVAEIFAAIGVRASTKELDSFIKGMNEAVRAVKDLRAKTKAPFTIKTNYTDLRVLRNVVNNTSADVMALRTRLTALGRVNITARATGIVRQRGGGSAGGGGGGGGHPGGMDYFGRGTGGGDIAAAMRFGGAGAVARQFLPGFGGAMLGMNMFQTGNQFVAMENSLSAVTGGTDQARKHMAWLRAEADRVGFSFLDTGRQFTNLAAAGAATGFTMEQTKDIFSGMAEAGRVLGMSTDDMSGALRAVQQMMSKGTVSAEELKGQLGERLAGAVGMAAKAMGKTVPELFKMMEAGELMSNEFLPKFAAELHKFAASNNALEKSSQSAAAQFDRLKNAWNDAMNSMAKSGALDAVAGTMSGLADTIEIITPALEGIGKALKGVYLVCKIVLNPLTLLVALIAGIGFAASASILPMSVLFGLIIAKMGLVAIASAPFVIAFALIAATLLIFSEIWDTINGKDTLLRRAQLNNILGYGTAVAWTTERIKEMFEWMQRLKDAPLDATAQALKTFTPLGFMTGENNGTASIMQHMASTSASSALPPSSSTSVSMTPTVNVTVNGMADKSTADRIGEVVLDTIQRVFIGAEAAIGAN